MSYYHRFVQWMTLAALAGCAADASGTGDVTSEADITSADDLETLAAEAEAEGTEDATPAGAKPAAGPRVSELKFEVPLRGTGKAQIHARVFTNPRFGAYETVLAVPGLAETGATYEPLANAIFADANLKRRVKRVIAIDLVGRGKSGFPEGLPDGANFGALTIEDNVSTVIESIKVLRRRLLGPQVIVGHSMGGLATQAVQETLLAKGSSLAVLGVYRAILLAPVPAGGRPWTQPVTGDLSAFVVQDPAQGAYVSLPPELWLAQAFSTTAGVLAPNAPAPAVVAERGYVGFEPLTTLLQLTGAPIPTPTGETITIPRPSVRAGAFAPRHGTRLTLLGFAQDVLVPEANLRDLYVHLSGDEEAKRYVAITSDDAVHSAFISNPASILPALRNGL